MKVKFGVIVSLLLLSATAAAEKPDYSQQIQIDADNLVSIEESILTYKSNVVVTQGSIQLKADQLEINATAGKGNEIYIASGSPVTYSQMMADGTPVTAQANEMRYEPSSRTLTLSGDAQLSKNDSIVKASVIRYNLEKQDISAESDQSKRVTTIITPEEKSQP